MENGLKIFENNEFGNVRIITGNNNELWFVAKDVCDILGTETRDVPDILDSDEQMPIIGIIHTLNDSSGLRKDSRIISESGLYSLVLRSRKPEAKKFKRWITHEVIPSIRKTGSYSITNKLAIPDFSNPAEAARAWANEYEAKQLALEEAKQKSLALEASEKTVKSLVHAPKTYNASELGKELGFPSAIAFNRTLEEMGVQFKRNGTWLPHAKYANRDWFSIKQTETSNGLIFYNTRFTGKGREGIIKLFEKYTDVE